ncbi:MAG: hypothetical protein IJ535_07285 [Pseudobutyrivibrio sp.]|uniref:hypothetical protein n=1 Tax=Pseudobutyrivibrio sp. TaxID=2014367 RepID=UPI0025D49AF4|nr:hypothetical protein [Pseudobutyrivibrio sp.]MBQ8489571.1 hypothetical protein [Pseudobutyrivibrio sp.]
MKKLNSLLIVFGIVLSALVIPSSKITKTDYSNENLVFVNKTNSDWVIDSRD